jgi:hypothetical protein
VEYTPEGLNDLYESFVSECDGREGADGFVKEMKAMLGHAKDERGRFQVRGAAIRPEELPPLTILEGLCGRSFTRALRNKGTRAAMQELQEAGPGGGQVTTGFYRVITAMNILGLNLQTKFWEGYMDIPSVGDMFVEAVPDETTQLHNVVGFSGGGEEAPTVEEGMEYPSVGLNKRWITVPKKPKYGEKISLTREAVLDDPTGGGVYKAAADIGRDVKYRRERDIGRIVWGIVNNYTYKNNSFNTYLSSGPYINVVATNELLDWTDIDASRQVLESNTDPETGREVLFEADFLGVMPGKLATAQNIVRATSIESRTQSSTEIRLGMNPYPSYNVASSRIHYNLLVASGVTSAEATKWWIHGAPKKAFKEFVAWDLETLDDDMASAQMFVSDILHVWRCSRCAVPVVVEPRAVVLNKPV